ncbi:hypothetical protein [Rhodobacter ferrooxidans]|uniref:FlgN family protein n=1 Tax=Rhodobacter ferrooxidans TaxID=371731 RepID=C8RX75_9RHOB|nr:hypothetical protein [Rhodobacter sp. SW2]EEW26600.1 hypothetical protein Rsw2DRAFT_0403 [Rhodobacter sp. SW2]
MQNADTLAVRALEGVLDRMHRQILAGALDDLSGLTGEIEEHHARLTGLTDSAALERLRAKAARNATCLQAAARGLRAARRRISDIHAARAGLVTYDGRGKRNDVNLGDGSLTQRF